MLSFLPQEHKQKILLEYRLRVLTTMLCFVSFVAVVALVGLLPTYLNEKAQADALRNTIEAERTPAEQAAFERKQQNALYADYLAGEIKKLNAQKKASVVVQDITTRMPSGVSLRSISLGVSSASITGVAATRSDLINFQRALEESGEFAEVVLPISDITKNIDAPFTIELSFK